MDFTLNLTLPGFEAGFTPPAAPGGEPSFLQLTQGKSALSCQRYRRGMEYLYLIGDCVFPLSCADEASRTDYIFRQLNAGKVHELKGFFYLLHLDFGAASLEVHSSFLQILPVYYRREEGQIWVSSSLKLIAEASGKRPKASDRYVVEKLLFSYAFQNRTPYEGIELMPSCHFLRLDKGGLSFRKAFEISDLYTSRPKRWQGRLDSLSDLFITETMPFIPENPFAVTLTGGFDGRTVLGLARHGKGTFSTFSYGLATDPDVTVPSAIGRALGFEHRHFDLGNGYAGHHFWEDGLAFIRQTEGAGNLSRAHYVHTARSLSGDFNCMLSGNFGSELLRSMKDPGVMASPAVFSLFGNKEKDQFFREIRQTPALRFADANRYSEAIEETAEAAWAYKSSLPGHLTVNQQFYLYMFGEVFRKYFGPEIVMQSNYLRHRAPFLDFRLFEALLGTTLAGANNDFRETNPVRRFQGQVLYAHILKKTNPELLDILLDRGYRPRDFLSPIGPLRIAWGYFHPNGLHRKLKKIPAYDAAYYRLNQDKLAPVLRQMQVLHAPAFEQAIALGEWERGEHELVNALSLELFYAENQ